MRSAFLVAVVIVWACCGSAAAQDVIRVATYNIKFLDTEFSNEQDREQKLEDVIELLDADVIALQEIDDRDALELFFPPAEWQIVIDDDSGERQDVAVVVRSPLSVLSIPADLDADDEHFLFNGSQHNNHFPDRRDILAVEVQVPGSTTTFFVMVVHAKSRFGGRASTESRRVGASIDLLNELETNFDDENYILLGDFNDNPDDRSMNILETGNPNAQGQEEDEEGVFLINLTEPLCAEGHVSHGRNTLDINGDLIDTIDPESRERNNDARGTDQNTGDILFDQILIPAHMANMFVQVEAVDQT